MQTTGPLHAAPGSTPPRTVTATVVVCAYTERRWDVLLDSLRAAAAQAGPADEVLLVVDHNEGLLRRARAAVPAGVRAVASTGRRGLSGARNTGVAESSRDVVVFLDDDAVPAPGWLEGLLAPFADDGVVGAGGVARPAWQAPRPAWFPEEFLWVVGCTYRGIPEREHAVRNPIGASMAFRVDALRRAGGFSEDLGRVGTLPLGCEETELSIAVAAQHPGSRIVHVPASVVRHHVTPERTRWSYFVSRCWSEGLSKAAVSRLHGAGAALSAERSYTTRVLPAAVVVGVRDALRGDLTGLGRAGAVVAGLAVTAVGYMRGRAATA